MKNKTIDLNLDANTALFALTLMILFLLGTSIAILATSTNYPNHSEFQTPQLKAYEIKQDLPPEQPAEEPRDSATGFYMKQRLKIESETNCETKETKITILEDTTGKIVTPVLITIRGTDMFYSDFTNEEGFINVAFPNGAYSIVAKSDEYPQESTLFKVNCKETQEKIIVRVVEPEPKKENLTGKKEASEEESLTPSVEQNPKPIETQNNDPQDESSTKSIPGEMLSYLPWVIAGIMLSALLIVFIAKKNTRTKEHARQDFIEKETKKEEEKIFNKRPEQKQSEENQAVIKDETPKEIVMKEEVSTLPAVVKMPEIECRLEETTPAVPEPKIHHYLRDLEDKDHFILVNGQRIKSVPGLAMALDKMTNETFEYHVTPHKNDFATWLYHAVGDKELAESIGGIKYKQQMQEEIENRIRKLIK